jgi:hypothetical protein
MRLDMKGRERGGGEALGEGKSLEDNSKPEAKNFNV